MSEQEFRVFLRGVQDRMPALARKIADVSKATLDYWFASCFASLAVEDAVSALDELFDQGGLDRYATIDQFPSAIKSRARRNFYDREGIKSTVESQERARAASLRGKGGEFQEPVSQSMLSYVEERMSDWKRVHDEKWTPRHMITRWTNEAQDKFDSKDS